ncbi:hypothetical protein BKA56DRAFT_592305 [Ilyonectria sp. MPI-CAGE-AT-0026]|nr:hypothetical protein BKA56DRAFT_592305 [Ilyonectria sp. MPI-CAGE-AT-0026]
MFQRDSGKPDAWGLGLQLLAATLRSLRGSIPPDPVPYGLPVLPGGAVRWDGVHWLAPGPCTYAHAQYSSTTWKPVCQGDPSQSACPGPHCWASMSAVVRLSSAVPLWHSSGGRAGQGPIAAHAVPWPWEREMRKRRRALWGEAGVRRAIGIGPRE